MKKVIFAILVLAGLAVQAQDRGNKPHRGDNDRREAMADLTPQQRADLHTKRMVLDLDLTEAQAKKVQQLNESLENKREEKRLDKEARKELTSEERYARQKERLDTEIEFKRSMKEILSEEQYAKFEKRHNEKGKMKRDQKPNRNKR